MLADEPLDLAEANLLISAEASPGLDIARRAWRGWTGWPARAAERGVARGAAGGGLPRRRRGLRRPAQLVPRPGARAPPRAADRPRHPHPRRGPPGRRAHGGHRDAGPLRGRRRSRGAEPEYLDPFDGWERRSVADLAAIVRRTSGLELRAEFLAPVGDRADPRADARQPARLVPAPPPAARRALDGRAGAAAGAGRRRRSRAGRSGCSPAPAATPRPRSGRPRSWPPTRGTPRRRPCEARLDAARDMRRRMN